MKAEDSKEIVGAFSTITTKKIDQEILGLTKGQTLLETFWKIWYSREAQFYPSMSENKVPFAKRPDGK